MSKSFSRSRIVRAGERLKVGGGGRKISRKTTQKTKVTNVFRDLYVVVVVVVVVVVGSYK